MVLKNGKKTVSECVAWATDGLLRTVTNVVLLHVYLLVASGGVKTMGDADRMVREVHGLLDELNYDTIKRAVYQLTKEGLLARPKQWDRTTIAITNVGKQRIAQAIPSYRTERPWDGHIYLVSYDIPTRANRSRDLLREYVKRTGAAILQESLWINPYNPSMLLQSFMNEHEIPGTILVSKLGRDGTIGQESLADLIVRVYRLDILARRYEEFLKTYRHPTDAPRAKIAIDYLAILKDDPQLPFPLIPKNFPAESAWKRYQQLIGWTK